MVVSYSISTSNHNNSTALTVGGHVVSYSISTSNHNRELKQFSDLKVVSYSISTSNHNMVTFIVWVLVLYLIPFLHQTTTMEDGNNEK